MSNIPDSDLQPITPSVDPTVSGGLQIPHDGYRVDGVAGPTQRLVEVGEETIQIVPHPTTNRFPWPSVENPKVPIYKTVDIPGQPVAPTAPPVIPVQAPVAPPTVATPPAPIPPVVMTPALVAPPPVVTPPVIAALVSTPAAAYVPDEPILPTPPSKPEPAPQASPPPQPKPAVAAELPVALERSRPVHIYSRSTREAWSVFRPAKLLKIMSIAFFVLLIGGILFLWLSNGSPTSIRNVPPLQPIINAK